MTLYHKHRIDRSSLPYEGSPVTRCATYERIAFRYNYVRANNPGWLHEVRAQRGGNCWLNARLTESIKHG